MDGSMACHSYMAQIWLKATYDMTFMWCMFSLASGYSFFPWYDWLKMIVPCQCEVGILVSPKVDESDLWWYQDMLSMWGRMVCVKCFAQMCI